MNFIPKSLTRAVLKYQLRVLNYECLVVMKYFYQIEEKTLASGILHEIFIRKIIEKEF